MNNIQGISNSRKNKMFEFEKQNIEKIENEIKEIEYTRVSNKDEWSTREYNLNGFVIYEFKKENEESSLVLISPKKLKGLSWSELINCMEKDDKWETNVEEGIWISSYNNTIKYIVSYMKEVLVGVELKKNNDFVNISYFAKSQEWKNEIENSIKDKFSVLNILERINYGSNDLLSCIKEFKNKWVNISSNDIEKQILIEEKEELEKRIVDITEQINKLSKQADMAEKETKKTIEEISKVTKENESLKDSIMNVRKAIAKKCAFLPIAGRILIREINKEFGENALPGGR